MKLVNIGFGNLVSGEKILAVVSPESAPIKRIVQEAKERHELIDATFGRKTKAVIITDSTAVIISALPPEKIAEKMQEAENTEGAE